MSVELQNKNWACMPKVTRDRIISTYFCKSDSSNRISDYNKGYIDALIHICGQHNLTSHIEPSELIFAEKQKTRDFVTAMYEHAKKSESEAEMQAFQMAINFLEDLLGEKCLPDTKEPSKTLNVGDKVRIGKVGNPKLNGQIGIIKALPSKDESRYEVGIDDGWTLLEAEYLEPYIELNFNIGDKCNYKGEEAEILQIDVNNPYPYLILPKNRFTTWVDESELTPYTENKEQNNRKQLYDALCQLESASINVRKCLVSL